MLTFGSLFAGIGGIDLGLERAGMRCVWQVEKDDYARRVLARHWPDVRRHDDVCTFPPEPTADWGCDVIAGGFPCQDISNAGRRAGIEGERSGLWGEFARIVRVLRPRIVLVENVAALLGRGLGRVLGDLAQCGYDAEWDCLPAAAFGALHIRNRVFLVAYAQCSERWPSSSGRCRLDDRSLRLQDGRHEDSSRPRVGHFLTADSNGKHGRTRRKRRLARDAARVQVQEEEVCSDADYAVCGRHRQPQETIFAGRGSLELSDWWATEPNVGRVVDGIPCRVDRLRGLGNAVVPQVAEWIGRRIVEALP